MDEILGKNYEHKLPINDMMNLITNHMDAILKWCQSYKIQNRDFGIFSDETVFGELEKVKRIKLERCNI